VAGFLDGFAQGALWAVALAVGYGVAFVRSVSGFRVHAGHFAERHGLVVIIALGESIVAVGVGASGVGLGTTVIVAAVLGIVLAAPPMASSTIIAVRLTPIAMRVRFRTFKRPFQISGCRLTIRRAVVSKATTMPIPHDTCLFVGRQGSDAFSDPGLLLRAGFFGSTGFPPAAYILATIIATKDEYTIKQDPAYLCSTTTCSPHARRVGGLRCRSRRSQRRSINNPASELP
jgi:hypothetical protein